MKKIDSKSNLIYKKALKATKGLHDEEVMLVVEGNKLINEAINSGLSLKMCFVDNELSLNNNNVLTEKAFLVSTSMLRELATVTSHSDIVAYFLQNAEPDINDLLKNIKSLLILDRIQDPGNLGTIMRTAEAMGIESIILLKGSCSPINSKVTRAAMGSSFRVPIVSSVEPKQMFELLNRHKFVAIALNMAEKTISEYNFPQKCAFIFGQEGQGIAQEILNECNIKLAIPMQGQVESLNVATAVAICLYAWATKR